MRGMSPAVRTLLNALAIGILVFLLWDVLSGAIGPVEQHLEELTQDNEGSWGEFIGYAALLAGGLGVGLLSLVYYDRLLPRRRSVGGSSGGARAGAGEGVRTTPPP